MNAAQDAQEEVKPKFVDQGIALSAKVFDETLPKVKAHYQGLGKGMELAILGQAMCAQEGLLVLEVMGHVQEEIAQKMKPELMQLIREISGASGFKISIELKEELEQKQKVYYTDTDKFMRLKELHPALTEFQRRFGLETDF
ncbi:hypothetical protein PBT90_14445 [Algoriphagus halophytocola]|uniref:hypothetical protein n=1 Tax=Algoriphagus halophytocola TaxID=2991499 RepID=UPI0022DCF90B|nr:hypothetical protein [Algoriphagus sp. TR-M9]WBL41951.1 hypothetical protein PBT90_14445 [Algoriphagus sp. TR-M9]